MALVLAAVLSSMGCATVQPGEVGVKQTLGRLDDEIHEGGPVFFAPGLTRVVRIPTRTRNLEVDLELPSREGLNVGSKISVLYRIRSESAPAVISEVGLDYEAVLVLSTFRSAAADVTARYLASDMYTSSRAEIEAAMAQRMSAILAPRGFEIEAVLMKSIRLPEKLAASVEAKLSAEQDAARMKFVLEAERQEAERKRIEAAGIRDAQEVIAASLNDPLIRWNAIEAFRELASSTNAKVIVTNGSGSVLVESE
jgi:regulator of protease activity HflC (stomatin/prohibitin superfamily)